MHLWFDKPASTHKPETPEIFTSNKLYGMNSALPIGNGKLGALVFGGVALERLVINEDSLWSGDKNPSGEYETMGEYLTLGNLWINFDGHEKYTNYRRELDLSTAITTTQYTIDDVDYVRECLVSAPDKVIVMRIRASKKGCLNGKISWQDANNAEIETVKSSFIDNTVAGQGKYSSISFTQERDKFMQMLGAYPIYKLWHWRLSTNKPVPPSISAIGKLSNGLQFATGITILYSSNDKNALNLIFEKDGTITFKNVNELIILITAATDYSMNATHNYRNGENPAEVVKQILDKAKKETWENLETAAAKTKMWQELKSAHLADYAQFFDRVKINLGVSTPEQRATPTDQRRLKLTEKCDPEFEGLMFQFGRYLLIASSRPGTLPANLQGIWNDSNKPAWHGDYHTNINIQMNYWLSEVANLSETHTPLFDLILSQIPEWRKTTLADKTKWANVKNGWAIRTSHNTMGGMGWKWDDTANAWYAHHFWEHFAFTQDKNWLQKTAYPLMREVAEFWLPLLKKLPDGKLVVADAWSPEHGPEAEDGVSYSQQIIWNHFNNTITAAEILDVDADLREKLTTARDNLLAPQIGKWGQLMEWMIDRDDPENTHRHTSHLFAVYPGNQISVAKTPELANAAKISLVARTDGGGANEWAFAWRTALYARLRDGDAAHRQVHKFAEKTCANLFGNHPPMQIDGNFGIAAGIAEMLLQSHAGFIELLPALPSDWQNGFVHGLRARGGYEISLDWQNGKLTKAIIKNVNGGDELVVSYGNVKITANIPKGESKDITFPIAKLEEVAKEIVIEAFQKAAQNIWKK